MDSFDFSPELLTEAEESFGQGEKAEGRGKQRQPHSTIEERMRAFADGVAALGAAPERMVVMQLFHERNRIIRELQNVSASAMNEEISRYFEAMNHLYWAEYSNLLQVRC